MVDENDNVIEEGTAVLYAMKLLYKVGHREKRCTLSLTRDRVSQQGEH